MQGPQNNLESEHCALKTLRLVRRARADLVSAGMKSMGII